MKLKLLLLLLLLLSFLVEFYEPFFGSDAKDIVLCEVWASMLVVSGRLSQNSRIHGQYIHYVCSKWSPPPPHVCTKCETANLPAGDAVSTTSTGEKLMPSHVIKIITEALGGSASQIRKVLAGRMSEFCYFSHFSEYIYIYFLCYRPHWPSARHGRAWGGPATGSCA